MFLFIFFYICLIIESGMTQNKHSKITVRVSFLVRVLGEYSNIATLMYMTKFITKHKLCHIFYCLHITQDICQKSKFAI